MSARKIAKGFIRVINKIITHLEPHIDEFTAAELARRFGQHVWNMIKAKFSTKDGSVKLVSRKDWLIIGIGEGEFDEHGYGKDTKPCCADLMAQHLGIQDDPKVALLLGKVRNGDRKNNSTPLDLGQCVRMLNHLGWSADRIDKWLQVFWTCYFNDRTVIKGTCHEEAENCIVFPVNDANARQWVREGIIYDAWLPRAKKAWLKRQKKNKVQTADLDSIFAETVSKLRKDLLNINRSEFGERLFNLLQCSALIAAYHPDDENIVCEWVEPIFWACLKFQEDFISGIPIIKQSRPRVIKPYPRCAPYEIIQVLGINRQQNKLANRRLASVAGYLNRNLDILILQQPTGNVQIMILRQHRYYLMPMIARAIRLEEMIAQGIDPDEISLDFEHLAIPGRNGDAGQWYMPINDAGEGYALFNGSLTIPNVSPTLVFFDRIMEIVSQMSITPNTKSDWYRYAKARLNRYRQSLRPTNNGNKLGDIARFK